jgi:predicted regulator of Ras-like GTPase activity (Roadblock/LC7/MglB family)
LEKPFDLHTLKEELRRLLQQTGFSASLDSFDLLDVIQIITMSRKSIALLVNTGLEERGMLRFQAGELIWAEYGSLRGEEAFFALAAHKNGVVVHQPWNDQITPNVTQPLSRLIFQALQYRTKYAATPQHSSEHEMPGQVTLRQEQEDDSPFLVLAEETSQPPTAENTREWWQRTDQISSLDYDQEGASRESQVDSSRSINITPSTVRKMPASQRTDLPSWLTDQPTHGVPIVRHVSPSNPVPSQVPVTPVLKPSPAEWQPKHMPPVAKTEERAAPKWAAEAQLTPAVNRELHPVATPEWQPPEFDDQRWPQSGSLKSLTQPRKIDNASLSSKDKEGQPTNKLPPEEQVDVSPQRTSKRDYSTLVSALQTLGYSVSGFMATAVITMDGHPIAQVTIDDLDISPLFGYLSSIQRRVLRTLDQADWGDYQDMIIASGDRRILLRLIDNNREILHVLITTKESDPIENLAVMSNVEEAIGAALR